MYLSSNGGLYGANDETLPARSKSDNLCSQCHQRRRASGDFLCDACRDKLEASRHRFPLRTCWHCQKQYPETLMTEPDSVCPHCGADCMPF